MRPNQFVFPQKLKYALYAIIIIFVLSLSLSLKQVGQVPSNQPSNTPTQTPNGTTPNLFISNYSPLSSDPSIANSRTAINITFNQVASQNEITSLEISFTPPISYKMRVNPDFKNIYLTPDLNWQNDKKYVLNIKSPRLKNQFTYTFTPTSDVNKLDIINDDEHKQ